MAQKNELVTAEELAIQYRVHPDTVRAWARRRLIPKVQLSRKVIRFDPGAVLAALTRRQNKAGDSTTSMRPDAHAQPVQVWRFLDLAKVVAWMESHADSPEKREATNEPAPDADNAGFVLGSGATERASHE